MFSTRLPANLTPNRLTQALRRRRSEGRPIVDLTESNPTRAGFAYPAGLLSPLGHPRGFSYDPRPFGLMEARAAIAADYARRGLHVPPERIALTASTSEAYGLLFKLLCNAGDDVLVPRPSYPLFDHLARLDAVAARPYALEYHGQWTIDFAGLERAFTPRTRAVLVVSPNNPTGSFIKRDELDRLAGLCAGRDVAIVADEVFADYALEPGAAAAGGGALERRDVLVFGLGGLSKSVGLPQIKLGWIATAGPDAAVERALERLELACDTYLSVSTPIQAATAELLAGGAEVRRQIQSRVRENYRQLVEAAASAPSCTVLRAEGGWFAVLQVPSLQSEEDLVLDLLERDGVLTHPGYFFDFPRESYLVVSLLAPEDAFARGTGSVLRYFHCSAFPVKMTGHE